MLRWLTPWHSQLHFSHPRSLTEPIFKARQHLIKVGRSFWRQMCNSDLCLLFQADVFWSAGNNTFRGGSWGQGRSWSWVLVPSGSVYPVSGNNYLHLAAGGKTLIISPRSVQAYFSESCPFLGEAATALKLYGQALWSQRMICGREMPERVLRAKTTIFPPSDLVEKQETFPLSISNYSHYTTATVDEIWHLVV